MILNVIVIVIGLIFSLILYSRFPVIKKAQSKISEQKISVIIPARNEESNIGLLLSDLMKQSLKPMEIICVNDESNDRTEEVIKGFPVKLINVEGKPDNWTGKSWACELGAKAAGGNLFIFLDADVRMTEDALASLVAEYEKDEKVISVQPFHNTEKVFEQFSMIFNIIQIGANAVTFPIKDMNIGLFGPVILIPQKIYFEIGAHGSVKESIVDDISLGENLNKSGFSYRILMGGKEIAFRMYSQGFTSLIQGWSKNFATGAYKTVPIIFIMVFWWITSSTSAAANMIIAGFDFELWKFGIYAIMYVFWILEIFRITGKIGKFKAVFKILYPVVLAGFLAVFFISLFKRIFRMKTTWKERKIKLEK